MTLSRIVPRSDVAKGVLGVSWPFLAIIVALVLLSLFSMDTLSAARALVGGESLWSKGQKEAVQELESYVHSGDSRDYALFRQALAVPLGDHRARLALERSPPDFRAAREGFVQGGNDPRDIPGIIRLFRNFHAYGPVARAVNIWRQGDVQIDRLTAVGQALQLVMQRGDQARAWEALQQALAIDTELTPLENSFSAALGDASRQAQRLLEVATALLALLLSGAGLARTRQVVVSAQRMADQLQRNEQRQKVALTVSDHGILDLDLEQGTVHLSANFMAALGYPDWPDQVSLGEVARLIHPADQALFESRVRRDDGRGNDTGRYVEYRVVCASGEVRWVRVEAGALRNAAGERVRLAGTMRDITEQRQVQEQLFEQTERALVTLDSISEAVVTTDAQARVDYMNPQAQRLLGMQLAQARGRDVQSLCGFLDELSRQALPHPVQQALARGAACATSPTTALVCPGGTEISVDASASLMHARDGSVFGVVLVLRDVRQDRIAASRMKHQATHDVLTGLINRREFESLVEAAVRAHAGSRMDHALVFLDLDRFKVVNDTCGHEAGDLLLRQISDLMKSALRETDALARLGGDEFAVLLRGCSGEQAAAVAEKLRDVVSAYRFQYQGQTFSVSASIGVLVLDDSIGGCAAALRGADAACYHAKEQGGGRIEFFQADAAGREPRQQAMRLPPAIQEALEQHRFRLYAQRIEKTRPDPRDAVRFEVLVRLDDGAGGLVAPDEFLPAAQRYHAAGMIDRWVVSAAFAALGQCAVPGVGSCAINLSGASIGDSGMLELILAERDRLGVDPRGICFELTESSVLSDIGAAQDFIERLRGAGFRCALDDFGAGMASFGYLKHLPVDYLKIDGCFVRQMLATPTDRAMVQSIQQIARAFGIQTVAEFVESVAIREALAGMGVDYAQGFAIHEPQPLEELLDNLDRALVPRAAGQA
ncbi:MAG: EAL domain-containing protein [Betaproteobacteria bacterium]|nr:EAL domain-containing protein [Betaproteobacteria bacterium]